MEGIWKQRKGEKREGGWTKEKGNEKSVDELGEKSKTTERI